MFHKLFSHISSRQFDVFAVLFVLFATVLFLFLTLFVVLTNLTMNEHGLMSGCPFVTGSTALCPMGLIDHLDRWRTLLLVTLERELPSLLIFMVTLIVFFLFKPRNEYDHSPPPYWKHPSSQGYVERKLFIPLLVAYSRGIIQPRLYA